MISVSGHPTYRIVDGERIEGTLRPVFIDNGGYHLTELMIYADGLIDCWELVDLEGFRKKVRSGWVATSIPEGAKGSAFPLASWRFAEPKAWVDADDLVGEVADEIERLNGRPTTKTRCLEALERYREQPTESRRRELSAAYLAIPSHERDYILGDMDVRDWPLRVLASKVGKKALGVGPTRVVTEENRASALAYFEERERETAAWNEETNGRDPKGPQAAVPQRSTSVPGCLPAGLLIIATSRMGFGPRSKWKVSSARLSRTLTGHCPRTICRSGAGSSVSVRHVTPVSSESMHRVFQDGQQSASTS
jgi:hypothetical protein